MICDIGRAIPRWILSTLNFICMVLSLFLLICGVLMSTIPSHVMSITEYIITREQLDLTLDIQEFVRALLNRVFVADFGHMLLVGSSCLLVSSTLGYVGAVRESRLLLFLVRHGISLGIFYHLILSFILIIWGLELVFLILLPAFTPLLYSFLSWLGQWSLASYRGEREEINLVTFVWNYGMAQLECCGLENYLNFTNSTRWKRSKLNLQLVPSTCCILDQTKYPWTISPEDGHCVAVPTNYNSFWLQGCLPKLSEFLTQHTSLLILVLIFILTLEMIAVILAVCLCALQTTRTDDKTVHRVIVREHPQCKQERQAPGRREWEHSGSVIGY